MRAAVPTPTTAARIVPVLAAALVLAVLVLGAIAARSGPWAAADPPAAATSSAPTATRPTSTAPPSDTPAPTPDADRSSPAAQLTTEVVVVVVAVLSLGGLALLLGALSLPRLRRRSGSPRATPGADVGPGTAHEALTAAVGRALHSVDDLPDAREAVVQAWLQLGAAAAAAGTAARPAETAAEQHLPPAALHRLADLYRAARFSAHPVQPGQRAAARAELHTLQAALAAAAAPR